MKQIFTDKKFLKVFLLGIVSGMPLSIIFSTLAAWLKEGNIDISIITTFAVARMPYSLKFLWAPLTDYIKIPLLTTKSGHRKAWLLLCSSCITLILYIMSYIDITHSLSNLYILAIALGICSATYDISFDAFRIENFSDDSQGQASAIAVMGYRIGMLITGAVALEISYLLNSWPATFRILSVIFLISTIYIFTIKEETLIRDKLSGLSLKSFALLLIKPLNDFLLRDGAVLILAVIILFKMGDAMLGAVAMPFYLELGFSKQQIALVGKIWGLIATLAGGYAGGWVIDRLGAFKGLIITGLVQSLTHFAFIWLHYQGTNYPALFIAISIENLGAGMGASALVAYLSILCNKKYSATQYALLSSAASFFNNTITIYAGQLVKNMGWVNYFLFTIILALPALILLVYMNNRFTPNKATEISPQL